MSSFERGFDMNLANVPVGFSELRGRNLAPLLTGGKLTPAPVVTGYFYNTRVYTPTAGVAYIDWPWKLFMQPVSGKIELFDLEHDPAETNDLAEALPLRTGPLQDIVSRYFDVAPK